MKDFTGMPIIEKGENFGDSWMECATKLQDQNNALIEKIKKIREKLAEHPNISKYWMSHYFDYYFKEELGGK